MDTKKKLRDFLTQKFRDAREASGNLFFTQAEWARELGLNNATLSRYMSASQLPEGDNLVALISAFPELMEILGISGGQRMRVFLHAFENASQGEQDKVIEFLTKKERDEDGVGVKLPA